MQVNENDISIEIGASAREAVNNINLLISALNRGRAAASKNFNNPVKGLGGFDATKVVSALRTVDGQIAKTANKIRKLQNELKSITAPRVVPNDGSQKTAKPSSQPAKPINQPEKVRKTADSLKQLRQRIKLRIDASDADNASKKVGMLAKLLNSLTRIAFYRVIRSAIKAVGQALQEGSQNAYWFSKTVGDQTRYVADAYDALASSGFKLQNQLGAAWATLRAAAAPVLMEIINLVTRAIDALTQFFAILSGKGTYMKAVDYTKEAFENTKKGAGAAKEWKNQLMGFDEINRLEEPSNRGGGGGAALPDYENMFVEAKVGVDVDTSALADIAKVFKDAWEKHGETTITTIKNSLKSIKDMFVSIGESFAEVFTNGTGETTLNHIFGIVNGISETIGNIADSWRKAWENDNTGTKIIQNLWDALNSLLGAFDEIQHKLADFWGGVDLSPLMGAFESASETVSHFSELVSDELKWAYENVLLPLASWVIEEAAPATIETLSAAFDLLFDAIELVSPAFEWLWDNILVPVGEWAGEVFISALDTITGLFEELTDLLNGNTSFKDFIDGLSDGEAILLAIGAAIGIVALVMGGFNLVMGIATVVTGAFNTVLAFLTSPITLVIAAIAALIAVGVLLYKHWDEISAWLKETWEKIKTIAVNVWGSVSEYFIGVWNHIKDAAVAFFEPIGEFFSNLWNMILDTAKSVWDSILDVFKSVWEGMKQIFSGIIDFVAGIFTGNWSRAWQGIIDIFSGIWDGITGVMSGVFNIGIGILEGFINTVIAGVNAVLAGVSGIASAVSSLLGLGEVRLSIGYVTLPRFATGGFPEDGLFMANSTELVGKFSNGKTAVANNEQIVEGIARGVEDANDGVINAILSVGAQVISAMAENNKGGDVDWPKVARTVTRYQNQFARAGG